MPLRHDRIMPTRLLVCPTEPSSRYHERMTIRDFVTSESALYMPEGSNRLSVAAAGAVQCEMYLEEIVRRYTGASAAHTMALRELFDSLPRGASVVSPEQQRTLDDLAHRGVLVRLEIESYYLFSKILLDRLAKLMHWWVGGTSATRGRSIDRHSLVSKELSSLVQSGIVWAPEGMASQAAELQRKVSNYRDHHVTHDSAHAHQGMSVDKDGRSRIVKFRLGAGVQGKFNAGESGHIEELEGLRDSYLTMVIQFLAGNRERSILTSLLQSTLKS